MVEAWRWAVAAKESCGRWSGLGLKGVGENYIGARVIECETQDIDPIV